MEEIVFSTLTAKDIDCRVGQVSREKPGLSLLLYKNARVDMAMLDKTVGASNWQREHYECKGNLFCRVGIRINNEWVWKADCGTESNTEAEKGESSDSFKRACVNWNIGRELYTAPFIWIDLTDAEYNKGKPSSSLRFKVKEIGYNNDREINQLVIVDSKGNIRYQLGKKTKAPETTQEKPITKPEQKPRNPVQDIMDEVDKAVAAATNKPQTQGYKPLSEEDYWKTIESHALGKKTNRNQDIRTWWYNATHAGAEELKQFDSHVQQYKYAHNIK